MQEAADLYNDAVSKGENPAQIVATYSNISMRTAGYRISHARAAGLIPPLVGKKTGKRNKRALDVAAALGIDYDLLVDAVINHAGGDLRVSR